MKFSNKGGKFSNVLEPEAKAGQSVEGGKLTSDSLNLDEVVEPEMESGQGMETVKEVNLGEAIEVQVQTTGGLKDVKFGVTSRDRGVTSAFIRLDKSDNSNTFGCYRDPDNRIILGKRGDRFSGQWRSPRVDWIDAPPDTHHEIFCNCIDCRRHPFCLWTGDRWLIFRCSYKVPIHPKW